MTRLTSTSKSPIFCNKPRSSRGSQISLEPKIAFERSEGGGVESGARSEKVRYFSWGWGGQAHCLFELYQCPEWSRNIRNDSRAELQRKWIEIYVSCGNLRIEVLVPACLPLPNTVELLPGSPHNSRPALVHSWKVGVFCVTTAGYVSWWTHSEHSTTSSVSTHVWLTYTDWSNTGKGSGCCSHLQQPREQSLKAENINTVTPFCLK